MCIMSFLEATQSHGTRTYEMCSSRNSHLFMLCHDVMCCEDFSHSRIIITGIFTDLGTQQMGIRHRVSIGHNSSIQTLRA